MVLACSTGDGGASHELCIHPSEGITLESEQAVAGTRVQASLGLGADTTHACVALVGGTLLSQESHAGAGPPARQGTLC